MCRDCASNSVFVFVNRVCRVSVDVADCLAVSLTVAIAIAGTNVVDEQRGVRVVSVDVVAVEFGRTHAASRTLDGAAHRQKRTIIVFAICGFTRYNSAFDFAASASSHLPTAHLVDDASSRDVGAGIPTTSLVVVNVRGVVIDAPDASCAHNDVIGAAQRLRARLVVF